ncbi:MAG: pantoate--beta-alanine ligase [Actinobacteria bacterium]|nr:pantoate--beta-alanine ligase [Actinomycetota bacterium]
MTSRAELTAARGQLSGDIGYVATMGALHAGHRALLDRARAGNRQVVVSIFVNPTQFGPTEDLSRYPRPIEADLAVCEQAGADLVWTPGVQDVYAAGDPRVTVAPGPLGNELEGAARPGHFAGVLTVVAKFFNLIRPTRTYFGEKDYQQLALVRRMSLDLDLGADVIGVPTVREVDGLALSSRNVYLDAVERQRAVGISRALFAGAADRPQAVGTARAVLDEFGIVPDYLELRGADLGPVIDGEPARLLVAARVGSPRLLDNVEVAP